MAHRFRGFGPWSLVPVALGLWQHMVGARDRERLCTSRWPGSRELRRGWTPKIPFKATPTMT